MMVQNYKKKKHVIGKRFCTVDGNERGCVFRELFELGQGRVIVLVTEG